MTEFLTFFAANPIKTLVLVALLGSFVCYPLEALALAVAKRGKPSKKEEAK